MKRQVAQLIAPKKFEVIEEEIQPIKSNQLLMKVISIGLCHSDIPAYLGKSTIEVNERGEFVKGEVKYPVRVGHEPIGIIEEVGEDLKGGEFKEGDYVTGMIMPSFASHVVLNPTLPMAYFTTVPKDMRKIDYCLGEPLMCISNIVRATAPVFGDNVAVIGCGMMGLTTMSGLAKSAAFELIGIDLVNSRLELAKKYGATQTVNPKEVDAVAAIKEMTGGKGVDIAVEISGSMAGFSLACKIVKGGTVNSFGARAKILIPSLYGIPQMMDAGYDLMYKSPIIHSTHPMYSKDYMDDLRKGIEGYKRNIFPLDSMITHEFKLEDINEAFEMLEHPTPDYFKGVVKP
jgi:threonine dehydrogenase-like Zn-dependent dehydrogenase